MSPLFLPEVEGRYVKLLKKNLWQAVDKVQNKERKKELFYCVRKSGARQHESVNFPGPMLGFVSS
jgi:hypothetical protein